MYKIAVTSFITLLSILQINGQSVERKNIPIGLYFGGMSYSDEMTGTGYYYFNKDSSFFFVSTALNINTPPGGNIKNSFSDTIAGYGKGRWFIKDNLFIIKFEPVQNCNLQNDDILYHSFLKYSYDSIFIKIQLVNKIEQLPITAAITIKELNQFFITDTLGFGEITLPLNYQQYNLTIISPGFLNKTIVLNTDNNVHEIKAMLTKKDIQYINVVSPFKFSSKFEFDKKKEIVINRFKKDDGGIGKLKQIISNGIKKMPEQKFFLSKIFKELQLFDSK